MTTARVPSTKQEAHLMPDKKGNTDNSEISSKVLENGAIELTYAKKGYGIQKTTRPLSAVRLELSMDEAGVNQTELAYMTGVTQTTISRILKGETLNSKYLPIIAEKLQKNPNWLAGLDQAETNTATISGNKLIIENSLFLIVPRFKAAKEGENGHIIRQEENKDDARMLLSSSIPESIDKDALRFYIENERAMNPVINSGATVFFENKYDFILSGEIYAILNGGQVSSRYLFLQPNGDILMRAKESNFPDFTIEASQKNNYILGRVIFVINKLS